MNGKVLKWNKISKEYESRNLPFCVQTIVWIVEVFLVIVYHIIKTCFYAGLIIW